MVLITDVLVYIFFCRELANPMSIDARFFRRGRNPHTWSLYYVPAHTHTHTHTHKHAHARTLTHRHTHTRAHTHTHTRLQARTHTHTRHAHIVTIIHFLIYDYTCIIINIYIFNLLLVYTVWCMIVSVRACRVCVFFVVLPLIYVLALQGGVESWDALSS